MATLFGIKNCDTVKKARRWLDDHYITHQFHDYKTDGLDAELLLTFARQLGWQDLINRSSTSWRQLTAEQQSALQTLQSTPENVALDMASETLQIVLQTPTLLKRPILHTDNQWLIGFKPDIYSQQLLTPSP